MTLTRRFIDDPFRAMHEAQVLAQVFAEVGEADEWDEMPETAATPALEKSVAHHTRNRAIRRSVVPNLHSGSLHDAETLKSPPPPALHVRQPRIRPRVDQLPAGREDSVYLG
ncbi:MAG TPA: hypothetical protein VIP57_00340 [Candidatus Dormibacteraeota bacterium]